MRHVSLMFGCVIALLLVSGPETSDANPPLIPPDESGYAIDMYCSCEDGTQIGEMVTGSGATCAAAEADAIAQLNCPQYQGMGMCEEGDDPTPTVEYDCYPDEGEIVIARSARAACPPPEKPWRIRLAYTYCDGFKLAIIGKGCTFREAYCSAKRRHCQRAPMHGGLKCCSEKCRILKRPCQPRRRCSLFGLFGL